MKFNQAQQQTKQKRAILNYARKIAQKRGISIGKRIPSSLLSMAVHKVSRFRQLNNRCGAKKTTA
jgi:hypothetical protein